MLDADPESVPEACLRHILTIVYYNIALEMGLSINMSAQSAFDKAEIYLRRLYNGTVAFGGDGPAASPSYGAAAKRDSKVLAGV